MDINSKKLSALKKNRRGKSFNEKLLANGETDTVSHKRLISVLCVVVLIILAFLSAFGHSANADYTWVFAVLAGGESTLTVIEKNTKKVAGARKSISMIGKRRRSEEDEEEENTSDESEYDESDD